jgi:hypothetical protein
MNTKNMKKISIGVAAVLAAVVFANPVFANALSPVKVKANASSTIIKDMKFKVNASSTIASSSVKRVVKLDQVTAKLQERADKEIDRRTDALNKLQEKIQGMKKVSTASKATFTTTVQGQINLLENLKVKIEAAADAATLKTDVQSITKAYRIYALILPQMEITAAADRLASTSDALSAYVAKLQTRIMTAQTAGKSVASLQTLIDEMNTKIADAKARAASALSGIAGLKPDNGDKTVMASNTTALKAARDNIKAGTQALKDANKAGLKIRDSLKDLTKPTATSTATSTATTTSR